MNKIPSKKNHHPKLVIGKNIYLRLLTPKDASQRYVRWLNDPIITKFLETKGKFTINDVKNYITKMHKSPDNYLFGIFLKKNNTHIGNIKIGAINRIHSFADIGLMIGEKSEWGKGYATEAIKLATKYAFEIIKLHSVWAGIYSNNYGSIRAFEKAGWSHLGTFKEHIHYEGKFINEILMEKVNPK